MGDHLGKNGMAVAGFFIDKTKYQNEEPGDEEQTADPLFQAYKELAQDQSWLEDIPEAFNHKTWTFAYGHNKDVAADCGCEDMVSAFFKLYRESSCP